MSRELRVGAAQLGPIGRDDTRAAVVDRLLALLRSGHEQDCQVVAFPELALTTFFPRWYAEDRTDFDHYYETEMPGPDTKPLFDEAARLGVGFTLGFAELTPEGRRFNTQILVDGDGHEVARYHKVHVPGHAEPEAHRRFQHLERYYFEPGTDGFAVTEAFGATVGLATCNDRRWPETYRVLGMHGVELVLIGYNTPIHYAPDPDQDRLAGFHNHLVMQAGAYQNGTWVVGVAKGGTEEGVDNLAESCIIAPSGELVAVAETDGDELVAATCDLDWCRSYTDTLFHFETYRRPELYGIITKQRGRNP